MNDPTDRRAWPVRKLHLGEAEPDDTAALSPAERVALVWPLTLAAWAFKQANEVAHDSDAPDRLPRHVVRVVRRRR